MAAAVASSRGQQRGSPASPARRPTAPGCAATLLPRVRITSLLGPMKAYAGCLAGVGEVGVLRQEAVARVDRVDLGFLGHPDDLGDVEIGRDRLLARAPTRWASSALKRCSAKRSSCRVDRHRAQPHLGGGPHHADRDLATVGDQEDLRLEFFIPQCASWQGLRLAVSAALESAGGYGFTLAMPLPR